MNVMMLVKDSESSKIVYNSIKNEFNICKIIIEPGANKKKLLKRRAKRLGWVKVSGQLIFQIIFIPILKRFTKKRTKEIIERNNLDISDFKSNIILHVNSINEEIVIREIDKLNPDVIVVNGTRIISKNILASTDAIFINIHAGITPKYRGVHGGYWALANQDHENCGVTVHLIDEGIDTGDVIYQNTIKITEKDNFLTYPLLQLIEGIDLLKKAIGDKFKGDLKLIKNYSESKLWHHPTIFQYIYFRIFKGIK